LTYCAFRKEHPHHDEAYLFLSFVESVEKEMVAEYLLMAVQEALLIISDMRDLVNVKRHV
jgi:hypothetical protein